jgi:hypothetical protein
MMNLWHMPILGYPEAKNFKNDATEKKTLIIMVKTTFDAQAILAVNSYFSELMLKSKLIK